MGSGDKSATIAAYVIWSVAGLGILYAGYRVFLKADKKNENTNVEGHTSEDGPRIADGSYNDDDGGVNYPNYERNSRGGTTKRRKSIRKRKTKNKNSKK